MVDHNSISEYLYCCTVLVEKLLLLKFSMRSANTERTTYHFSPILNSFMFYDFKLLYVINVLCVSKKCVLNTTEPPITSETPRDCLLSYWSLYVSSRKKTIAP